MRTLGRYPYWLSLVSFFEAFDVQSDVASFALFSGFLCFANGAFCFSYAWKRTKRKKIVIHVHVEIDNQHIQVHILWIKCFPVFRTSNGVFDESCFRLETFCFRDPLWKRHWVICRLISSKSIFDSGFPRLYKTATLTTMTLRKCVKREKYSFLIWQQLDISQSFNPTCLLLSFPHCI